MKIALNGKVAWAKGEGGKSGMKCSEEAVSLATLKQTMENALVEIKKTQNKHCYSGEMSNIPYAEYLRGQKNSLLKVLSIVEKLQKQLQEKIQWVNENTIGGMASEVFLEGKREAYEEVLGEGNKP